MGQNGTSADGTHKDAPVPAAWTAGAVELILIRHGESQGNVAATDATVSGAEVIAVPARDADVELSSTGREQVTALGRALAAVPEDRRPDVVISSPYMRAYQTA